MPDRPVIELNEHAIGRIDGAIAIVLDPYPGRRREPVRPGAGCLACFVQEIQSGPFWVTKAGLPTSPIRHISTHLYVPVKLSDCADAGVATTVASKLTANETTLMKIAP